MVLKKNFLKTIPIVVVLTLMMAFPLTVFGDAHEMNRYKMTGKITGIDPAYKTIVIEVPLESQMFTVGGPLASDAKLFKEGEPALLADFVVGETVTVIFHSTDQGHVIDRLAG